VERERFLGLLSVAFGVTCFGLLMAGSFWAAPRFDSGERWALGILAGACAVFWALAWYWAAEMGRRRRQ